MKSSLYRPIPFSLLFLLTFDCRLSQFFAATAISALDELLTWTPELNSVLILVKVKIML
jgi:hypothetical protein